MNYNLQKFLLILVNIFYLILSISLIILASYCYASPKIKALSISIGILLLALVLFLVSLLGIYGAKKHHQAALFFYSLFMILIFIIQYCLSIASLAAAHRNLVPLITRIWKALDNSTKIVIMNHYQCCALDKRDYAENIRKFGRGNSIYSSDNALSPPQCENFLQKIKENSYHSCGIKIEEKIDEMSLKIGNIALAFSFLQIFGVWLAAGFRNTKMPIFESMGRRTVQKRFSDSGTHTTSTMVGRGAL